MLEYDEDCLINQINTFDTVNKINSMKNGKIINISVLIVKTLEENRITFNNLSLPTLEGIAEKCIENLGQSEDDVNNPWFMAWDFLESIASSIKSNAKLTIKILKVLYNDYINSETSQIVNKDHYKKTLTIRKLIITKSTYFQCHILNEPDLTFNDLDFLIKIYSSGVLLDRVQNRIIKICTQHPNYNMERMIDDFINS